MTGVSLATLAPPPGAPTAHTPPPLPDPPMHLQNGGPGVARLPAATGWVALSPLRYLAVIAVPLLITVLLILTVPVTPWPVPQPRTVQPVTPVVPAPRTGRRTKPSTQRRSRPSARPRDSVTTAPAAPVAPVPPSQDKMEQLKPS